MMRGADAIYANQANYWTDENPDPNADFPRMWPGNAGKGTVSVLDLGNHNFYPQSKYLVNMAYLRFKNLTIGYTLPKIGHVKFTWIKYAFISVLIIFANL